MADKPDMLSIITRGNIASLSDDDRTKYVLSLCEALGLDPKFKPIDLIPGKGNTLTAYLNRGAADSLAKMHGIQRTTIKEPTVVKIGDVPCVICTARATDSTGRYEQRVATVVLKEPGNDYMKCETKAIRRATIAMLGIGMLDESELDGIRGADALADVARAQALQAHVQATIERIVIARPQLPSTTPEELKRAKSDLWKAQVAQLADDACITPKEAHDVLMAAMKR